MKTAIAILLLSIGVMAQVPDAPSHARVTQLPKHENPWKPDWTLYATTGVHVVATELDVRYVQHCEHTNPPGCFEANPGKDQWAHRWPEIALGAGATYGCQLMLTGHKYWRRLACPVPVLLWSAYQAIDGTRTHYVRNR